MRGFKSSLRWILAVSCLSIWFYLPSKLNSQVIDQAEPQSAHANALLNQGTVTAGENFRATVNLNIALVAGTTTTLGFTGQSDSFSSLLSTADGSNTITFTIAVPKDIPGGEYKATAISYNTGRHWNNVDLDQPVIVKVIPVPSTTVQIGRAHV